MRIDYSQGAHYTRHRLESDRIDPKRRARVQGLDDLRATSLPGYVILSLSLSLKIRLFFFVWSRLFKKSNRLLFID